ncbi:MAG TPA: flagellar hook-associated protein FlgL [Candidatus Baltobacteraceae bacterium]|nr:flagellar hook-associated protein FlgL [Candidatus Baltobacteraceae bacterium]
MRIATSTVYGDQSISIDNLAATYQQQGQQLSTGKSLNNPSDNPQQIAQDIAVRNDNAVTTQVGKNLSDLSNQLTTVDGALSSLTSIFQRVRSLAVQGASETNNASQLQDMATQVAQMFQETVGLANTQYAGKFVFAGTAVPNGNSLVQSVGIPPSAVTSQGNQVQQIQQLPNGQTVPTGVTLQQAFNLNAANGSPSAFQTLVNLYNTLQNGQVVDESSQGVNVPGQYVDYSAASPPGTTLTSLTTVGAGQILATPLVTVPPAGVGAQVVFNVANGQNVNGVNVTIPATDNMNQAVAAINAQLAAGGISVTASFNQSTQRLSLASTQNPNQTFEIQDIQGNFTTAFGLTQQATTTGYISTQLGDIDAAMGQLLNARSAVGASIQTVNSTNQASDSQVLNDTTVQSGIEDTDIAKVTSQFTQTQTVLQAAYATTSRLEAKTLFDYL